MEHLILQMFHIIKHYIVFVGKRDLSDNSSYSLLWILSPYVNGKKETDEKKGIEVYGVRDKIKGSEYRIRMMKNSKII